MSLVGKKAPNFTVKAVVDGGDFEDNFSLKQFEGDKYVVFFFYPLDFTFVCPTEILAFQTKLAEFEKLNTQVVGCSVDSHRTHWAWLHTPKEKGGIQGVTYPLVADLSKTIAMNYGVLAGEYDYDEDGYAIFEGVAEAYRGLFLIDKDGIVRHELVNDTPLGRNIDEVIRMIKALQHHEEKGEVCPANWDEGKDAMVETPASVADYLSTH